MKTPSIDLRFVGHTLWRIAKIAWLTGTTLWFAVFALGQILTTIGGARPWGGDAVLYAKAAGQWIHGQDPWLTSLPWGHRPLPVFYLAPPPTLLPFLPFAWLPQPMVAAFWVTADVAALVFIVRRLKLSPWWLLFPPAVDCAIVGNPELVMAALVVGASGPLAGLGPLFKPYAVIPLIGRRQWTAIVVTATVCLVTIPLLQWDRFINDFSWIQKTLALQLAFGDQSAWGFKWAGLPVLVPLTAVALLAYGRKAWWLAMPVLWPTSQMHYAVLALPALSPWMAIGFGLPMPGSRGLMVIAGAVGIVTVRLWERRSARAPSTSASAGIEPADDPQTGMSVRMA